jgi:hypothetical protein
MVGSFSNRRFESVPSETPMSPEQNKNNKMNCIFMFKQQELINKQQELKHQQLELIIQQHAAAISKLKSFTSSSNSTNNNYINHTELLGKFMSKLTRNLLNYMPLSFPLIGVSLMFVLISFKACNA